MLINYCDNTSTKIFRRINNNNNKFFVRKSKTTTTITSIIVKFVVITTIITTTTISPVVVSCFPIISSSSSTTKTTTTTTSINSNSNTIMSQDTFNLPIETLASTANAYAAANGLQVEKRIDDSIMFQCAPISLLPNAYPKDAFEQAIQIAPLFNILVDKISHDSEFLQSTLGGSVSNADPYTAKLLQLYNKIYCNNNNDNTNFALQADRLGIHRSDYMLHKDKISNEYCIKQVELNTIAASFAGLARQVAKLHSYMLQRYNKDTALSTFLKQNQKIVNNNNNNNQEQTIGNEYVPDSPSMEEIPIAINIAVQRYKERFIENNENESKTNNVVVAVLFVVQDGETNTVDQRMLEFHLFHNHKIPTIRLSLKQIHDQVQYNTKNTGAITLNDNIEFAVVYYRAGYAPTDYPDGYDGIEWQAREKLERSRATKCPSLGYHLAGTKKVQQQLSRPGVLERFFPNEPEQVAAMRTAFAGLYSLGDDAEDEDLVAVNDVLNNDDGKGRYVLKPQREGGGYNFYGENLLNKLKDNTSIIENDGNKKLILNEKLGEYILMERLFPPQQKAILLRNGIIEGSGDSISELGCFGTIVSPYDGKDIIHNTYAGFLLRTKFSNVDEGGVASGFATLSSPYLC